eukprot:5620751-Karenia_brevis.AAC.1
MVWRPLKIDTGKEKMQVPVANVVVRAFIEQNWELPCQVAMQLTSAWLVMRNMATMETVLSGPNGRQLCMRTKTMEVANCPDLRHLALLARAYE